MKLRIEPEYSLVYCPWQGTRCEGETGYKRMDLKLRRTPQNNIFMQNVFGKYLRNLRRVMYIKRGKWRIKAWATSAVIPRMAQEGRICCWTRWEGFSHHFERFVTREKTQRHKSWFVTATKGIRAKFCHLNAKWQNLVCHLVFSILVGLVQWRLLLGFEPA